MLAGVLLIFISASFVVQSHIDQQFVIDNLEKKLGRSIEFERIDVGLFSAFLGIKINKLNIYNFGFDKKNKLLKIQNQKKLFASADSAIFKISLFHLLKNQIKVKSIVFQGLRAWIDCNKKGYCNFSDLLLSPEMDYNEKEEYIKYVNKKLTKKLEKKLFVSKYFKVDELTTELILESITIENSTIYIDDKLLNQKLIIYNIYGSIYNININPEMLITNNNIDLELEFAIKTASEADDKSKQQYFIGYNVTGKISPFDSFTRRFNPEINLTVQSNYGMVENFRLLEKLQKIKILKQYFAPFEFIDKEIKWEKNYFKLWIKEDQIKIKEGLIRNEDFALYFAGNVQTKKQKVKFRVELEIANRNTVKASQVLNKKIEQLLTNRMKKYITAEEVTSKIIKKISNKQGNIYLSYSLKGFLNNIIVKLKEPAFKQLSTFIKLQYQEKIAVRNNDL